MTGNEHAEHGGGEPTSEQTLPTAGGGIDVGKRHLYLIAAGVVTSALIAAAVAFAVLPPSDDHTASGPGPAASTPRTTGSPGTRPALPSASASAGSSTTAGGTQQGPGQGPGQPPAPNGSGTPQVAPPTNLSAEATGPSTVLLKWKDNSDNETGFTVYVKQPTGTFQFDVPANTTRWDRMALIPGTQTCFVIVAYYWSSAYNVRPASGWVCATTPDGIPAAPTNVTATLTASMTVHVRWTDNSIDEFGFIVRVYNSVGWVGDWEPSAPEFLYPDVAAGGTNCFDVRAANQYGESPWAPRACASTMHLLPAAPSGVTARATGPTTILVTWVDNSGNEDGFHVLKNGFLGTKYAAANATSYEWTGLTPGTEGCFRVRAYNSYGTSSQSLLACATTPSS